MWNKSAFWVKQTSTLTLTEAKANCLKQKKKKKTRTKCERERERESETDARGCVGVWISDDLSESTSAGIVVARLKQSF